MIVNDAFWTRDENTLTWVLARLADDADRVAREESRKRRRRRRREEDDDGGDGCRDDVGAAATAEPP